MTELVWNNIHWMQSVLCNKTISLYISTEKYNIIIDFKNFSMVYGYQIQNHNNNYSKLKIM